MGAFDKLFDFIVGCVQLFQCWNVCDEFERGVLLRLGRYKRDVGPGFMWCFPFGIDRIIVDNVVTRTVDLPTQTLTTRDDKSISLTVVVTCNIRHIKKALLDVEGVDHALADACAGTVGDYVRMFPWAQLRENTSADRLTEMCRANAWRYGIEVERVQLRDITPCKVIRLHIGATTDTKNSHI